MFRYPFVRGEDEVALSAMVNKACRGISAKSQSGKEMLYMYKVSNLLVLS